MDHRPQYKTRYNETDRRENWEKSGNHWHSRRISDQGTDKTDTNY